MNKSNCCGAEVSEEDFCMRKCCKCKNFCDYADLAPALRDSKEILEFVEKIKKEELSKGMSYGEQRAWVQGFIDACYKIENFILIERKE
jgi:hypothetical protein